MNYENILITENNIATITINRPTKLNALNVATISDLNKAFKILAANDEVRVIVLTGSGEKHLSQVLIF
jgi:enoyl-CoA hydratase